MAFVRWAPPSKTPRNGLHGWLTAALLLANAPGFAQTALPDGAYVPEQPPSLSAQIYGIVDAGVRHVDQSSAAGSLTQFASGLNTSRIGFAGSESLGGDLHAGFRLESGFNPGTGVQSNSALFDRTAALSLGGKAWDLKLGRQEGFGYEQAATGVTDPLHMALNFPNYSSPAAAGSKAPVLGANPLQALYSYTYGQLRFENALRLSAGGEHWWGGLMYALGGVAGSRSDDTVRGAHFGGKLGPALGEAIFQQSLDQSGHRSTLGVVAGTWTLPSLTLQAGFHDLRIDAAFDSTGLGNGASSSGILGNSTTVSPVLATAKENFRYTVADLGATWLATDLTPLTLAAYKTSTDGTGAGHSLTWVALGKYYLSKRTTLYLELSLIHI